MEAPRPCETYPFPHGTSFGKENQQTPVQFRSNTDWSCHHLCDIGRDKGLVHITRQQCVTVKVWDPTVYVENTTAQSTDVTYILSCRCSVDSEKGVFCLSLLIMLHHIYCMVLLILQRMVFIIPKSTMGPVATNFRHVLVLFGVFSA